MLMTFGVMIKEIQEVAGEAYTPAIFEIETGDQQRGKVVSGDCPTKIRPERSPQPTIG
jgi:hypothetical protein